MDRFDKLSAPVTAFNLRSSRREAIKISGLAVTLGALAVACGNDRGGSADAGRVGNAPTTTALEAYPVDDAVLLRTAASLEWTAVEVYETAKAGGFIPDGFTSSTAIFLENHRILAEEMNALAVAAGGEAWGCANPWLMDRLVNPVLTAITTERVIDLGGGEEFRNELSDQEKVNDILNFAGALENLAVASHQTLVSLTGVPEVRLAHANAASLEARQAAELAIEIGGINAYVSYGLLGDEPPAGAPTQFAIPSQFGQTSQIEIKSGPGDQNGGVQTFTLQTPAANSFVYNELTCDA